MKKLFTILLTCSFLSCAGQKTEDYNIETRDISNFWVAYDAIKTTADKEKVFKELYHDKASPLFKEQLAISGDMRDVNNYLESFKKYPKFWESLRKPTMEMHNISEEIQQSFDKVRQVYPDFKTGDVCIFISPLVVQGRVHEGRVIVLGAEMNAPLEEVDLSEFEEDMSFIYQNDIKSTIVHETIHLQQKGEPSTLLDLTIHEGSADFLAELFLGVPYQNPAYEYGRAHEKQLWQEFSKEMNSPDYSKWLYGDSMNYGRPMDMGYFMGYVITKSFYEKSTDKDLAIKQIIEVTDYDQFLRDSGYAEKFKK